MYTIVWRGFGIIVPILFIGSTLLGSWILDDETFLRGPHVKWCMLICGVLFSLLGIAGTAEDEEVGPKKRNSFMLIPVGAWGVLLLMFLT